MRGRSVSAVSRTHAYIFPLSCAVLVVVVFSLFEIVLNVNAAQRQMVTHGVAAAPRETLCPALIGRRFSGARALVFSPHSPRQRVGGWGSERKTRKRGFQT